MRTLIAIIMLAAFAASGQIITKVSELPRVPSAAPNYLILLSNPGVGNSAISVSELLAQIAASVGGATNVTVYTNTTYNYYSTNVYQQDSYISNYFTTNVFNDTYMSNFFNTNVYTTNQYFNTYTTNLYNTNSYVSNYFNTNIFQNTYNSNFFTTNQTYQITTNYYYTYVNTNNYFTNITAKNVYVTEVINAGSGVFTNGITNLALTANQYVIIDANKKMVSTLDGSLWQNLPLTPWATDINAAAHALTNVSLLQAAQLDLLALFATNVIVQNNVFVLTNSWSGPTNDIDLTKADQYYATWTPCSITGVINKSNSVASSVLLTITNKATTNITLQLPNGFTTGDGAKSYTITNATCDLISIRYSPVGQTNAVFRAFW